MHRCFIDPAGWNKSELKLSSSEEHHLLHVLRAGSGDTVAVFDGCGREARARVVLEGGRVALKVLSETRVVRSDVSLTLIQALPKGRRMELIIEKSTELGVSTIFPVISEHVVTGLSGRQAEVRAERWRRIALNAAKQCGLSWVPEIKNVLDYKDVIAGCDAFDLFLVGSFMDGTRPFKTVLKQAKVRGQKEREVGDRTSKCGEEEKSGPRNIALLIGPEGDLTPEEVREALDMGAIQVSFGPLVMRVETAALYGLSVLAYEFL